MSEARYSLKIKYPNGRYRIMEIFRPTLEEAERDIVWIAYQEHAIYRWEQAGRPENIVPDFLPLNWSSMTNDEKFTFASKAGYKCTT